MTAGCYHMKRAGFIGIVKQSDDASGLASILDVGPTSGLPAPQDIITVPQ